MCSRAYKPIYGRKKNITTFQYCQSRKPIMCLRDVLYKPQLPKASHYKRDKEMRKRNIASHGCKNYIEKILITLSTKTVHRTDIHIVIKPRYCMDFLILEINNLIIFQIYFSSKRLSQTTARFCVIKFA